MNDSGIIDKSGQHLKERQVVENDVQYKKTW